MFENNTDRMFWTIAVLILGATLLMIGNKAFPKAQESIMTTISQNITTSNDSTNKLNNLIDTDSDNAKKEDFKELENFHYIYKDNGTIEVTGYKKDTDHIDIPKWGPAQNSNNLKDAVKVTSTGKDAFIFRKLTSITLPNSIEKIGVGSFYANNLTNVNIPDSVKIIDDWAFKGNELSNLTLPDSITSIGGASFQGNKIKNVKLSNNLTNLGRDSLSMNEIDSISFPTSLTEIGPGSLWGNQLKHVTIPNSIKTIGYWAFKANQLESVNISNSVNKIETYAFVDNPNLTNVNVPKSVTDLNVDAFDAGIKINRT